MTVEISFIEGWGAEMMEVIDLEEWTPALLSAWRAAGRPGLIISDARTSLDFLPTLEGLRLLAVSGVIDGSDEAVGHCQSVENLVLATDCTNKVDLSRLHRLRKLNLGNHRRGIDTLPTSLEALTFWGCRWRDLGPLARLQRLRRLDLSGGRLVDVSGLDSCVSLTQVRLNYIKVADPFRTWSRPPLTRVGFEAASGLRTLEGIETFSETLEYLSLVDCPNLGSLAPLASLRALRFVQIAGRTNVSDGDLSPLRQIPGLRAIIGPRRKHYSPTVDELALEPRPGEVTDSYVFSVPP